MLYPTDEYAGYLAAGMCCSGAAPSPLRRQRSPALKRQFSAGGESL
jgi:hypothetical protein